MGVTNLMTPYVRDHASKTNSSIKKMLAENPEKDRIGIDMSIIIVRSIKNKKSLNILNRYHCSPTLPLPSVTDMVVQKVGKFLFLEEKKKNEKKGKESTEKVKAFSKAFCVFDGLTHPLKAEVAHVSLYEKTEEERKKLEECYKKTEFSTSSEKKKHMENVTKLRTSLIRPSEYMIHDIVQCLKRTYKDKVTIVGSPFEADHQLAALFHQNVIDWVYTEDAADCSHLLRGQYNNFR